MSIFPIPDAALASHIGILGKTGSGKSNAAKVSAEILMGRDERVCVVDPTGTWWGLRLWPDRKPSTFKPVIFGGQHGDVAIAGQHGAAIGEAIATSSTSAIIDTRQLTVGDRTRFFTDFAETLLRKNEGPLHLIIDEAHLFAPKMGAKVGGLAPAMLHAANNLVSLGRGAGLRIILLTQRPAKLHNDSLTQVETLVAMRLLHNRDVDAVRDWIGEWADPAAGKELVASLPALATGDAWVWSPLIDVLQRVHFPLVATFDSGKPPKGGETGPALKPIDISAIAGRLEAIGKEVLANDPRTLKAKVAELERQMRDAAAAAAKEARRGATGTRQAGGAVDPAALAEADRRAREAGRSAGFRVGYAAGVLRERETMAGGYLAELQSLAASAALFGRTLAGLAKDVDRHVRSRQRVEPPAEVLADFDPAKLTYKSTHFQNATGSSGGKTEAGAYSPDTRPVNRIPEKPVSGQPVSQSPPSGEIFSGPWTEAGGYVVPTATGGDAGLPRPIAKIVDAIGWWNVLGIPAPSYAQLSYRAGYAPKGGTFNRYLSEARSRGLVLTSGRRAKLTDAGSAAAAAPDEPPTGDALRSAIIDQVDGPLKRLLGHLIEAWPEGLAKAELGKLSGYEASGGTFNRYLSSLRSLELVENAGHGHVAAAEWMFP